MSTSASPPRDDSIPMQPILNGSDGKPHVSFGQQEKRPFLPEVTTVAAARQRPRCSPEVCDVQRLFNALDGEVVWKCRVWMLVIIFIVAVIFISVVLCSVLREDPDDTFDKASYQIPRDFNGTFLLTNQASAEELLTSVSNQSQVLALQLQEKLSALYHNSPALGRYFSHAEVYDVRNGSEAVYSLSFLMPLEKDKQEQLLLFTLSRKMVYNILRQFLYDQETDASGPPYIDPRSLRMY